MLALTTLIIVWLTAGALTGRYLSRRIGSRKVRITHVFVGYVVCVGVFAQIYFYLYTGDPGRFAFTSDLLSARTKDVLLAKQAEVNRLKRVVEALEQLGNRLRDKEAAIEVSPVDSSFVVFRLPSYTCEFVFDLTWSPTRQGKTYRGARLVVSDENGRLIGSEPVMMVGPDLSLQRTLPRKKWDALMDAYFPPKAPGMYQDMIVPLRQRLKRSVNQLSAEIAGPADGRSEYWKYWDFFYFSVITQTTVGYGDILPNSLIVRVFVVLQVLLGLLLLAIVLSWVLVD